MFLHLEVFIYGIRKPSSFYRRLVWFSFFQFWQGTWYTLSRKKGDETSTSFEFATALRKKVHTIDTQKERQESLQTPSTQS